MKINPLIPFFYLALASCGTGHAPLQDVDGNQYRTKRYGEAVWMLENLRATKDKKGNDITFYYPNRDSTTTQEYGLLYDFETACKVCPEGWRLPSIQDWENLFNLRNQNDARLFKDKRFWTSGANSNESEFSVRPAGYGNIEHPNNFNKSAIFWSSSKEDEHFIWTFILEDDTDSIRKASQHPEYAFSVRCVKDDQ
ncbi:fibrobacter succinogenes major paralogous domain-containing protein [Ekhidna sp.]|uniref:fibrobacter succinogenes major paralogous domain-containing protein n=1 Tax=Ekhidna sp. TaxID=2608089 RepID=UPI003C7DA6D3